MTSRAERYALSIHLILICTGGAAVVGFINGLMAIARHGYPAQGMWVNAALVIRDATLMGTWAGAAAGVILAIMWWLTNVLRDHPRWRDWCGATPGAPCIFAIGLCMIAVTAMLMVRSLVIGHVANHILWSVLIGSLGWCVAFIWARRSAATSRVPAMLYAGLFFSTVWGTFIDTAVQQHVPVALFACACVLATVAFSPVFAHDHRRRSVSRTATLGLASLAIGLPLAVALWAASARPVPPMATPHNIVLIGIDTLRLDRTTLGESQGDARSYTPRLQELARRGTVFDNAISQAPWTLPAFSSIMTGLYPHQHGAVSLFGKLRDAETTIAEVLREHGYATAAVVSHIYVDAAHGFAQGFDHFDEACSLGHDAITAGAVTDRAIAAVDRQGDRPFFMFVHYFDPHSEFKDHTDWAYADHYHGWLNGPQNDLRNLRNKRHLLEQDDIDYISDLYDEEVAYTDREIGRLLDHLEFAGFDDNTIIVVTADHGEELMDRGWIGHTISLFDELIRVPLLVVEPGSAPARRSIAATVETRALFPTILEWAAVAPPMESGPSLIPRLAPANPHAQADAVVLNRAYSSVWLPDAELKTGKRVRLLSLRTDTWKLVQDHTKERTFLFDLANDPDERIDVSTAHPERVDTLLADLSAWWGGSADRAIVAPSSQPSRADMERLRALGYVE